MRIYCQNENICAPSMEKGNVFGFKGSIAKTAQGKAGWMGAMSVGVSALLMGFVYAFVVLKAWRSLRSGCGNAVYEGPAQICLREYRGCLTESAA